MCQTGTFLKTATERSSRSMSGTIPHTDTQMGANAASSSAPDRQSFCERAQATPDLFGESSSTTAAKKASTAPSSETKARSKAATLSDRLTPSLISFGLVRGITPTSIRKRSGVPIPDIVFHAPDGSVADGRKADCLSSSASKPAAPASKESAE